MSNPYIDLVVSSDIFCTLMRRVNKIEKRLDFTWHNYHFDGAVTDSNLNLYYLSHLESSSNPKGEVLEWDAEEMEWVWETKPGLYLVKMNSQGTLVWTCFITDELDEPTTDSAPTRNISMCTPLINESTGKIIVAWTKGDKDTNPNTFIEYVDIEDGIITSSAGVCLSVNHPSGETEHKGFAGVIAETSTHFFIQSYLGALNKYQKSNGALVATASVPTIPYGIVHDPVNARFWATFAYPHADIYGYDENLTNTFFGFNFGDTLDFNVYGYGGFLISSIVPESSTIIWVLVRAWNYTTSSVVGYELWKIDTTLTRHSGISLRQGKQVAKLSLDSDPTDDIWTTGAQFSDGIYHYYIRGHIQFVSDEIHCSIANLKHTLPDTTKPRYICRGIVWDDSGSLKHYRMLTMRHSANQDATEPVQTRFYAYDHDGDEIDDLGNPNGGVSVPLNGAIASKQGSLSPGYYIDLRRAVKSLFLPYPRIWKEIDRIILDWEVSSIHNAYHTAVDRAQFNEDNDGAWDWFRADEFLEYQFVWDIDFGELDLVIQYLLNQLEVEG